MHKHELGRPLTIGRPLPNNNVYILDENARPVEFGSIGTMWAGGAGVTRGYLGLPDRTAERYRPDPFVNDAYVTVMISTPIFGADRMIHRGAMMFNTGDLARWLPDGNLEILGRNDDQVKIKVNHLEILLGFTQR